MTLDCHETATAIVTAAVFIASALVAGVHHWCTTRQTLAELTHHCPCSDQLTAEQGLRQAAEDRYLRRVSVCGNCPTCVPSNPTMEAL